MHSSLQNAQVGRPALLDLDAVPPGAEIVRAFMANPDGPHGAALQHLLNRMRAAPVARKLALLVVVPDCEWQLVRLPAQRGGAMEVLSGQRFTVLADAERAAFRMRWQAMFEVPLPQGAEYDV